jgi:hypothetical protein
MDLLKEGSFRPQLPPMLSSTGTRVNCGLRLWLTFENRFRVLWGAGKMTRDEIEGVGFEWCECSEMMQVDTFLQSIFFHPFPI